MVESLHHRKLSQRRGSSEEESEGRRLLRLNCDVQWYMRSASWRARNSESLSLRSIHFRDRGVKAEDSRVPENC